MGAISRRMSVDAVALTMGLPENQVTVLKTMGFTNGEQVAYFDAELKANPQLKALFSSFENDFAKDPKYKNVLEKIGAQVIAEGTKVEFDTDSAKASQTGIIDKLAKDLSGPNGEQVIKQLRENPEQISGQLDGYAAGTVDITAMLPKAGTSAPAPAADKQKEGSPSAAPITVSSEPTAPPATATPPKAANPAEPAANAPAPGKPVESEIDQMLTRLAGLSDEGIKKELKKDDVKLILAGMADQASSKFGVDAAIVDGFRKKVGAISDPSYDGEMVSKITKNFQNNPEFVRQLAKAAKNKEPMDKAMVDMARPIMTGVMENPEKLADDKYVKDLSQKMNMASTMGGFGKILNNIFGEGFGSKISGWFSAIFAQIKNWISGFTGDNQVISMRSAGNGSFLPTVMVNLDAINANRGAAAAQELHNPSQMTALSKQGADGKYFHDEQVKGSDGKPAVGPDGKPVLKSVMNGAYTITDVNGKQHSVMPAVGQLEAKQAKDGNVHGRFVTKINQGGDSDGIATYIVSADEFKKYQAATNKIAADNGLNRTVAFSAYTAEDAANAAKAQTIQMVAVDSKTGAASPVTPVAVGAPQEANPSVGYTVVNGTVMRKDTSANKPSANDQDYSLQA